MSFFHKRIDTAEVERLLAAWTAGKVLEEQEDPEDGEDGEPVLQAIAMDGKVLCGSNARDLDEDGQPLDKPAQQQLSVLHIESGAVVGQRGFSGKKDEAERVTLREVAGPGVCILADALNSDRPTAQHLMGLGLDFVLNVKDKCG